MNKHRLTHRLDPQILLQASWGRPRQCRHHHHHCNSAPRKSYPHHARYSHHGRRVSSVHFKSQVSISSDHFKSPRVSMQFAPHFQVSISSVHGSVCNSHQVQGHYNDYSMIEGSDDPKLSGSKRPTRIDKDKNNNGVNKRRKHGNSNKTSTPRGLRHQEQDMSSRTHAQGEKLKNEREKGSDKARNEG